MSQPLARRDFVKQSAVLAGTAAAFTIVPRHVLGGPRQIPPSEKMNIAGIGVGGMGGGEPAEPGVGEHRRAVRRGSDHAAAHRQDAIRRPRSTSTTARCWTSRRTSTAWSSPRPTTRTPSSPLAAMRAGKHVYCQKPLTHDVYEARMLAQIAKETKVATQMGIQGHSARACG